LGCSLWSRSVMLGSAERRKVRVIIHEIIFEEFQRVWSQSTNVTDRWTDGQLIMTIPHYAMLRAVKMGGGNA